jgi:hypothetical protein
METILSPPKNNLIQDSEENKKMDNQFWTPTTQRNITPRNPVMFTRTPAKKKSCKYSLRISWSCS